MKASTPGVPDGTLAEKALRGDERAFAEIVRRHKHALFRVVFRVTGNEDDSLEMLQETFISAHAALGRYDAARPMQAWLTTIALNKARDWRRRQTVRRFIRSVLPVSAASEVPDYNVTSADVVVADKQELAIVSAQIVALPARLQQVLVLRTLEGLSQAETAELLGISEKAVETRLYRARQRLASRVRRT